MNSGNYFEYGPLGSTVYHGSSYSIDTIRYTLSPYDFYFRQVLVVVRRVVSTTVTPSRI